MLSLKSVVVLSLVLHFILWILVASFYARTFFHHQAYDDALRGARDRIKLVEDEQRLHTQWLEDLDRGLRAAIGTEGVGHAYSREDR